MKKENNLLLEEEQYRWAYRSKKDPNAWISFSPFIIVNRGFGGPFSLGDYTYNCTYAARNIIEEDFDRTKLSKDDFELVKIKIIHTVA